MEEKNNKLNDTEEIDKEIKPKEEKEIDKKISKETNKKCEEYLNGWKRCQADFENYKKRQDERMKELGGLIKEDVVLQLLPVLDNFNSSLEHVPEEEKNNKWVEGILHIQRQLENILNDNGISKIEAKEGDIFNPEIHEAVQSDSKDIDEHSNKTNVIKKVVSEGCKMGDKVIRAAKVIVK